MVTSIVLVVAGMETPEHRDPRSYRPTAGYAMAGLLVAVAVMSVMLTAVVPAWTTWAKREREAELIFRGGQYARAVRLYGARFANAYPPDIETLVEGRFLRKAYRDPMVQDGQFELVTLEMLQVLPPITAVANPAGAEGGVQGATSVAAPFTRTDRGLGDDSGPIVGVRSRSTDAALRQLNGLTTYADWVFTPTAAGELGGHTIPTAPADSTLAPGDETGGAGAEASGTADRLPAVNSGGLPRR